MAVNKWEHVAKGTERNDNRCERRRRERTLAINQDAGRHCWIRYISQNGCILKGAGSLVAAE